MFPRPLLASSYTGTFAVFTSKMFFFKNVSNTAVEGGGVSVFSALGGPIKARLSTIRCYPVN